MSANARLLLALACAVVCGALWPRRARAVDLNVAGSAQLDYLFVPFTGADPRPATHTLDGFTEELSLKLAVDVTPHVSANVKVCWGCHGFELGMGYADLRAADEFNVRIGRFNPAFGEFYLRHDVANHRLSDKPLPYDMGRMLYLTRFNRSVLPIPYVENGIEVSGSHFFGSVVQLEYAAHAVAGMRSMAERPYDVDFIAMRQPAPYYVDNNSEPSVGGRLGLTLRLSERVDLTLGGSALYGHYDRAGQLSYAVLGTDFFLRAGRTNIRAEYLIRRTEMAGGPGRFEAQDVPGPSGALPDPPFMAKDGWYAEIEQPINRAVEILARWDGLHRIGNVAPGSPIDVDAGMQRWTLGANFTIERGFRIKTSGELYQFWGLREAPRYATAFHLSGVVSF